LPTENEEVVAAFDAQHPRFKPLPAVEVLQSLKIPHSEDLCSADGRFLRLWPHRHATDGFFASIWQAA
jgi:16S rRNA (cytosine967-C5)-methyltransferase